MSLRICADSPEPSMLDNAIRNNISCTTTVTRTDFVYRVLFSELSNRVAAIVNALISIEHEFPIAKQRNDGRRMQICRYRLPKIYFCDGKRLFGDRKRGFVLKIIVQESRLPGINASNN